jgi:citrate lyase beta subunit
MMKAEEVRRISPIALGATLYMPALRDDIVDIIMGRKLPGLRSLVLCLEDALADCDIEDARANLRCILSRLEGEGRNRLGGPLIFVRPRSVAMAAEIALEPMIAQIDGFVAPKVRNGQVASWTEITAGTQLYLMPTLETAEVFDAVAMRDLRDELRQDGGGRILALRIGGNDLLSCLGLRRSPNATLYEGPLGHVVAMLAGLMIPAGFNLTAPVFEAFTDYATLSRELEADLRHGLVGKTAVHPCQVGMIQDAFRVSPADHAQAQEIIGSSLAVFQRDGVMCEPKTHLAWAARILERAHYYGFSEAAGGHLALVG